MAQTKAEYDALKAKYSEASATLMARRNEEIRAAREGTKCPNCGGGWRGVSWSFDIFDHFAGCRRW